MAHFFVTLTPFGLFFRFNIMATLYLYLDTENYILYRFNENMIIKHFCAFNAFILTPVPISKSHTIQSIYSYW